MSQGFLRKKEKKNMLPEGINDNFALDTLDGINHHRDCSRVQLLKALHGT